MINPKACTRTVAAVSTLAVVAGCVSSPSDLEGATYAQSSRQVDSSKAQTNGSKSLPMPGDNETVTDVVQDGDATYACVINLALNGETRVLKLAPSGESVSWATDLGPSSHCSIDMAPNGNLLVAAPSYEGTTVSALLTDNGRPVWTRHRNAYAWDIAALPDGGYVLIDSAQNDTFWNSAYIYDASGREISKLTLDDGQITDIATSSGGKDDLIVVSGYRAGVMASRRSGENYASNLFKDVGPAAFVLVYRDHWDFMSEHSLAMVESPLTPIIQSVMADGVTYTTWASNGHLSVTAFDAVGSEDELWTEIVAKNTPQVFGAISVGGGVVAVAYGLSIHPEDYYTAPALIALRATDGTTLASRTLSETPGFAAAVSISAAGDLATVSGERPPFIGQTPVEGTTRALLVRESLSR